MATQTIIETEFARHIRQGLSANQKYLSSKYIYDDAGSKIFQQIMDMPEYYLTNAESEILASQSADILKKLPFNEHFQLVELGAGDGSKTKHLLKSLLDHQYAFDYVPIDISEQAIADLEAILLNSLPDLSLKPRVGDYFEALNTLRKEGRPTLLLFLGSNIGNFEREQAIELLQSLVQNLHTNDALLIGFDLKKNPQKIHLAYNDPAGITKAFNLNLLHRINKEFKANFDVAQFDFYSYYDPLSGDVRSFIISLEAQEVRIETLDLNISFAKDELIRTELSKKYSLAEIEDLADQAGLEVLSHFTDTAPNFVDSLLRCK